ncbi:DUF4010 domain-containing protein [Sphingomonas sp. SFZ2018-12]|uniref:MgtC/SapB family protein n=1 Tax=Sphingomonas sp. SFZ2018-12 TaxID=2683197 RepID=UPI001F0D8126|nr:DUF4010 domain-containing protein [Sphingomonas sp. SFZ2018-12]MCH4892135.1 DUF4010 domain-containing protein [Sphingomonas sp. SFZ2018-12]
MTWDDEYLGIGAAVLAGLLIGIERGWKLRDAAAGSRVAGVRTFSLLGLLGGMAGLIGRGDQIFAAAALITAAAATIVIGYVRSATMAARLDATSAIAGIVTLALGLLAGGGRPVLGIAGAALAMLILAARRELHAFIDRLDAQDVKSAARFAVIAVAVRPFLPAGNYGPYDAWNPQSLWLVVVLVTGFSFAGFVANRLFGARHGTIATAVIGGAYSSTAVTQSLAQTLRSETAGGAECAGIALASAVMYLRVGVLVAMLAPMVFPAFLVLIAPAFVVSALAGLWLLRTSIAGHRTPPPGNPIALLPALAFVVFIAMAAVVVRWAEGRFGASGIAILILIMGSLDVDAAIVTVGGLDAGAIAPTLAALALGGTVLANMAVKLGITIGYARSRGRDAAIALAASMAALALALAWGWFGR